MVYANDFAPCDGKLRVYFVGHSEKVNKADAFVICYEKEIYLIDGGHTDTYHGIEFLLGIRKEYLKKRRDLVYDTDCKLRINVIVSHFHVDHVDALLESISTNSFIDFADVYIPEKGNMPEEYMAVTRNCDKKYREPFMKAVEKHHPRAIVKEIGYGEENAFSIECGDMEIDFYPFPFDPCGQDYISYMCEIYSTLVFSDASTAGVKAKASTFALNAGSLWVRFKLGDNTFLFTGDTMKRFEDCENEAVDIMMKTYSERIGKVTVLKYVHHGYARDTSAKHMLALDPSYILLTTQIATAGDALLAIAPDAEEKIINCGLQTVLFECDKDSDTEVKYIL